MSKRIEVEVGPGESAVCPNCGGTGKDPATMICVLCGGDGVLEGEDVGGDGELCRGCDRPLPPDDDGVEADWADEYGAHIYLYCSTCAKERGL